MARAKRTEETTEKVLAAVLEEARANDTLPEVIGAPRRDLISELVPSRLAPCTETQAASPRAVKPGTTVSGLPSLSVSTSPTMPVGALD